MYFDERRSCEYFAQRIQLEKASWVPESHEQRCIWGNLDLTCELRLLENKVGWLRVRIPFYFKGIGGGGM